MATAVVARVIHSRYYKRARDRLRTLKMTQALHAYIIQLP